MQVVAREGSSPNLLSVAVHDGMDSIWMKKNMLHFCNHDTIHCMWSNKERYSSSSLTTTFYIHRMMTFDPQLDMPYFIIL